MQILCSTLEPFIPTFKREMRVFFQWKFAFLMQKKQIFVLHKLLFSFYFIITIKKKLFLYVPTTVIRKTNKKKSAFIT